MKKFEIDDESKIDCDEMLQWIIDAIYSTRITGLHAKRSAESTNNTVAGYVWEQYEGVFSQHSGVQLIWLVQFFVIFYGVHKAGDDHVQKSIQKLIDEHGLEDLLAKLSVNDAKKIRHSLEALKDAGYL
jgi:hypothetical protein